MSVCQQRDISVSLRPVPLGTRVEESKGADHSLESAPVYIVGDESHVRCLERGWIQLLILLVEKLSKHERQGYSLIKRQGGDREERAWKTPQAAPGKILRRGKWVPNSKEAQRATKGQQKQVYWQGQKSSWSPICRRKTQGKTQEGGEGGKGIPRIV
ncbi:hypothetical protein CHARACLAT_015045 [Characodon lateralis]|uniref:Uncharacterized protein n=1 Tax=Characodon lateralis TaxID=208331 RepID=A0ABU7CSH2_9TELE|nr:hypothetical protein [Characodon lateralis]